MLRLALLLLAAHAALAAEFYWVGGTTDFVRSL